MKLLIESLAQGEYHAHVKYKHYKIPALKLFPFYVDRKVQIKIFVKPHVIARFCARYIQVQGKDLKFPITNRTIIANILICSPRALTSFVDKKKSVNIDRELFYHVGCYQHYVSNDLLREIQEIVNEKIIHEWKFAPEGFGRLT
jgi:predicted ATPase